MYLPSLRCGLGEGNEIRRKWIINDVGRAVWQGLGISQFIGVQTVLVEQLTVLGDDILLADGEGLRGVGVPHEAQVVDNRRYLVVGGVVIGDGVEEEIVVIEHSHMVDQRAVHSDLGVHGQPERFGAFGLEVVLEQPFSFRVLVDLIESLVGVEHENVAVAIDLEIDQIE